ncbi:MAG: STAS domain-containing protein, partial [Selenomonadaceae bacterium]|nr:STAS domain-containing protein [Selenomonadaceae bacterium]
MEFTYNAGSLLITLPARIDANNAADFEKELFAIEQLREAKEILPDAENLTYISSLGLRVILKLAKKFRNTPLLVINASNEVYNVFDATGMTS